MEQEALSLNVRTHSRCHKSGQPVRYEIFSVENDLSTSERIMVSDCLCRLANVETIDSRKEKLAREAARYRACGHGGVLLHCPNDNLEYYIRILCRSRICEACSRRYVRQIYPRLKALIVKAKQSNPRFILAQTTLTITSQRFGDNLPDRDGIKRLYRESRQLLNLYFGRYVCHRSRNGNVVATLRKKKGDETGRDRRQWLGAGWFAVVEIGRDNNNLHIHAMTWGPYRAVQMLRQEWSKITGDSFGVDIRQKSIPQTVQYVLKYLTKPPATDSYQRLAEYAVMIKGSRRFRCGGIFYGQLNQIKVVHNPLLCFMCQSRLLFSETVDDVANVNALNYFDLKKKLERDTSGAVLTEIERSILGDTVPYDLPF
jgi:hypothetical protein